MKIKITVSKNELQNKLKAVSKVIKPTNLLPEHNSFLFEVDNKLEVTGADEMGNISSMVDCVISEDANLSFLIDAKLLLDGLKELPEQPLEINIVDYLDSYLITLIHSSGTYKFNGAEASRFSKVEVDETEMKSIEMDAELLISGIKKVYHFAGTDELRPILTSVYIESKADKLNFVSANTSIMAVYVCPAILSQSDFDLILPVKIAKIITELIAGEETVNLNITDKNVSFQTDDKTINYRLLEGKYPNYRSIIPKGNDKLLNCSTDLMVSAIRRTSIFSNKNSRLLILKANQSILEIHGKDMDMQNSANEEISVDYSADPIEIGFKSDLLSKCVEAIDTENMTMSFSDPTRACLIYPADETGGELTILIMPMLVNV